MKYLRTLTLSLFLLSGFSQPLFAEQKYTVGIVPQYEASKLHRIWRPILDFLEQETGHTFELKGSYSISEFEEQFANGEFDFAYMNPYHLVVANEKAGYIPLVRDTGKTLHGILVTRKDSGIASPSALNGRIIAFPSPNALGASLQMRQELKETFAIDFDPVYVKSHDSVYLSVFLGRAAAGGGVQKTFRMQKPEIQQALTVIHKTQPVTPHPFAALPATPPKLRDDVTRALLKLGSNMEGQQLLEQIPIVRIGTASIDDYLPLKSLGLDKYYLQH